MTGKRNSSFPGSIARRTPAKMRQVSDQAMEIENEGLRTIETTDFRVERSNSETESRFSRLKQAVRKAGGNLAVSSRSGVPNSTLSAYLAGQEWKVSAALALAEACNVSLEWLVTGQEPEPRDASGFTTPQAALAAPSNYVAVPRYDVRASAGGGNEVVAEKLAGYISLDEQFLRQHIGRRREDLVTIEATGESMAPTIRDGSILFVDIGTREIDDGRVYVLSVNERLLVKRLQLRANGNIVLRSDNPDYPQEEVTPSDRNPLHIIGQVVYQAGPVRA